MNGDDTAPLYKFLKSGKWGIIGDDIQWNFAKFLVDRNGQPVDRYYPTTSPLTIEVWDNSRVLYAYFLHTWHKFNTMHSLPFWFVFYNCREILKSCWSFHNWLQINAIWSSVTLDAGWLICCVCFHLYTVWANSQLSCNIFDIWSKRCIRSQMCFEFLGAKFFITNHFDLNSAPLYFALKK